MTTFTQGPPDLNTPVDSVSYRQWFEEVFQFLSDVPDLLDQNTFSGQMNIWGNYVGTGQLYVQQQVNDPASSNWAIVGQTINSATMSAGATIVGGFFQTQAVAGGANGEAWGIVTEVLNGTLSQGGVASVVMVGGEFGVVQQYNNNTSRIVGINSVFKDRPDGATAPYGGLGSNKYNNNSIGILLSSQPRSTSGEFCGWSVGILFDVNSIDSVTGIPAPNGVGIDMHNVSYTYMVCGVWVADQVQYRFSTDGAKKAFYDGVNAIRFQDTLTDRFGINMANGMLNLYGPTATTVGAAGTAAALPANPVGYLQFSVSGTTYKVPYYNV
ncbi:MAG: hypothetical protein KGI71_06545 [Patescibacteria group bacterium]|nr:hypothetical protein [Patescibacteria group bacterium]